MFVLSGNYRLRLKSLSRYSLRSKHPPITTCELRTSWQKFATSIPKNTRTCLAKQDQEGSYMWVTVIL